MPQDEDLHIPLPWRIGAEQHIGTPSHQPSLLLTNRQGARSIRRAHIKLWAATVLTGRRLRRTTLPHQRPAGTNPIRSATSQGLIILYWGYHLDQQVNLLTTCFDTPQASCVNRRASVRGQRPELRRPPPKSRAACRRCLSRLGAFTSERCTDNTACTPSAAVIMITQSDNFQMFRDVW